MTKTDIAMLASRILALYVLLQAIQLLPISAAEIVSAFNPVQRQQALLMIAPLMLPVIASAVLAWMLWFKAYWLAGRLSAGLQSTSAEPPLTGRETQRIAFTILGGWVLAQTIPQVAGSMVQHLLMSQNDQLAQGLNAPREVAGNWALIVRVLLGGWLLLGASGIVEKLNSLRISHMGSSHSATSSQEN